MTNDDVLSKVLAAAGATEGYELRHFQVWRQGRPLDVTLLDAGTERESQRYMVAVTDTADIDLDKPNTLSNPEASIERALNGVHWNEFPGPA